MLLRGVFDTLDEAAYIEGADAYLQLLQVSCCSIGKLAVSTAAIDG
jgi:hypothetical protein